MKRTNLKLIIAALIALCFVSCKKTESPDLHLLELKGKVQSVTYYATYGVNSKGKKTRQSRRGELETYNLNEKGQITTINYGADHGAVSIRIARNKKGQIETISVENLECDGGNTKKYTWNANGYPINEEYIMIGDLGYTCNILYNDSNEIIGKNYYEYWEEECVREWSESYTVMEVDEHGNWIKRLCRSIGNNTKYSIEERIITYYEDMQNDTSDSWIYGTWKCRTPYGTIEVILREDGRMYNSTEEGWHNYTIEGSRIIEQCDGFISTYNIDRANKRFDCGEPGVWFYKE